MLTGIAGLVIPRRGYRRVRRITRRSGAAASTGQGRRLAVKQAFRRRPPAAVPSPLPDPAAEEADGTGQSPDLRGETVEEFYQE